MPAAVWYCSPPPVRPHKSSRLSPRTHSCCGNGQPCTNALIFAPFPVSSGNSIYFHLCSYFLQIVVRHAESPVKPIIVGTKTPVLLKPCPTGAIFDSAENLRKLSALRADVSGRSGGNDASLLSCFFLRPPQSRGNPRKTARKRLENPLRGRDAAPTRRRPHNGSQGRTRGFFSLLHQLLLCPLAFGSSFGKV